MSLSFGAINSRASSSISQFRLDDLEIANKAEVAGDPQYVKARSVLDDVDLFDAEFFGINPREAALMDPQQRLFLESCWQALEDAGYVPDTYPGQIGVYAGSSVWSYFLTRLCTSPGFIQAFTSGYQVSNYIEMMGNSLDFLSTRVSYKLNLRGPSFTMQSACSTSLLAVTQACQSLLTYQSDMALAGGVSITFPQKRGYYYQDGGMVSPDGHCRAFDADAQGTVFGSGVGVVLLKRVEDAVHDGDQIYAVIRGFAVNNDGSTKVGYTAPSVEGQARVIAAAQEAAGVEPESIGYIEAHGTGTPLGDPIELEGLTQAFGARSKKRQFCTIGTAKTNVGHLDVAAGVTGLINATHIVRHGEFPPTLHFRKPNPKFDFEHSPFLVRAERSKWRMEKAPRRAGVSSFGVGGTNVHVVIEQAPERKSSPSKRSSHLIVLSARSETALDHATGNLVAHLKTNPDLNFSDVAWTLQAGRRPFACRRTVSARGAADAVSALSGGSCERVRTRLEQSEAPAVCFLFPGQGSQHPGMAREVYHSEPVFRDAVDRCAEILRPHLGADLRKLLYPPEGITDAAKRRVTETAIAQPAIFTIEYALAQLWMSWGVRPQAMAGHSIGEFVAACIAGVFSLEDALALVAARGRMMQDAPPGGMLSVRLPEPEVVKRLREPLSLAAVNSPALCVVAGPSEALDQFEQDLNREGVASRRLVTSHAFHSAMMEPFIEPLTDIVSKLKLNRPEIPYLSGVTGTWITERETTDPSYWARHAREPVQFSAAIKELRKDPNAVLLEVGPGNVLATLARQHSEFAIDQIIVSSLSDGFSGDGDSVQLMDALGSLWLAGITPDWSALYPEESRQRVSLPTYPFQRKRYDLEVPADSRSPTVALAQEAGSNQTVVTSPVTHATVAVNSVAEALSSAEPTATPANRKPRIRGLLVDIFEDLSGQDLSAVAGSTTFLEMGFDSLFLTQVTQALQEKFGLKITFRQLLDSESNLNALGRYIDDKLPQDDVAERAPPQGAAPAASVSPAAAPSAGPATAAVRELAAPSETPVERLMREQRQAMNQLFANQLAALQGLSPTGVVAAPTSRATIAAAAPQEPDARATTSPAGEGHSPFGQEPEAAWEAPVTESQLEIWLSDQLGEEASCSYNEAFTLHMRGHVNESALRRALSQIVNRHDCLRATFNEEGNCQRFAPKLDLEIPTVDLTQLTPGEREARLKEIVKQNAHTPFDLGEGPLIRAQWIYLEARYQLLIFTAHHIVCDGWSTNVLIDEIAHAYNSIVRDASLELPAPMSFAAYAKRQQEFLNSPEGAKVEQYWLEQFKQPGPLLDLPLDHPRPSVRGFDGATYRYKIGTEAYNNIKKMGARQKCTLFITLLAGWQILLNRLSGQDDIVVGVPTAGQSLIKDAILVGHCVNFIPLRGDLAGNLTAAEFLAQMKQTVLAGFDHQNYTYGRLVRKLALRRDPSRLPLTEILFNLERIGDGLCFDGIEAEIDPNPKSFVNFDLFLNVLELKDGLVIDCDYDTRLFEEETIARWLGHYELLLEGMVANVDQPISKLPLLSETESFRSLEEWNATGTELPAGLSVHGLFEKQVKKTPDSAAIVFEGQELTFGELDYKANQLANYLQKLGVKSGVMVGLFVDRSLDMVVALLGILKSGGTYVPMDPTYPQERLRYILDDARVSVVVTQRGLTKSWSFGDAQVVSLDRDWELIAREDAAKPKKIAGPEDLAYVIYTSGSTGKPKGVEISHRAVVNLLQAMITKPGLEQTDVLAAITTLSFDISGLELFLPLSVGAKLAIVSQEVAQDAAQLLEYLKKVRATVMQATPVTWRQLIAAGWTTDPALKVLCGGEALPRDLANQLVQRSRSVWNMYGPTETTIWSAVAAVEAGEDPVRIGHPIANTRFYVLDKEQQPVPLGLPGELYISGLGVARGYLNKPELTAERFLLDPFSSEVGARMYRTGDIIRRHSDGSLEFLGRSDDQVKLRGLRIELGEVEAVLASHPEVAQAVVLMREDVQSDKRLVAYLVPAGMSKPTSANLRDFVVGKLPAYMAPAAFMLLEAMPLTPNGKVDRRALPAPDWSSQSGGADFVAPRSPDEKTMAGIWAEVLRRERVGIDDNLFELGADLLHIFQIAARARKAGLAVTPRQILVHRTIRGIASGLAKSTETQNKVSTLKSFMRSSSR